MNNSKFLDEKGLAYFMSKLKTELDKRASLDDNGKVSISQLPSDIDDVVEFSGMVEDITILAASTASAGNVVYDKTTKRFALAVQNGLSLSPSITYFSNWPNRDNYQSLSDGTATPYTGKIFIDTSTNKTYRWDGSDLTELSPSLNLGETSDTAFAGDRGVTLETGMTEVKAALNTKGAKNGLAPLDANRQLAEEYLPSSAIDVVEFGGFADGITIQEESVSQISSVVFDREQNRFAGVVVNSSAKVYYYNNWLNRYLYSEDLEGKPIAGKLYVNTGDRKIYRWTGEQMEEVSGQLAIGVTADTAFAGDKGAALEQNVADTKAQFSKKADLGDDGKVLSSQLPSYVSEALEFTGILDNITVHPATTTLTTGYVVFDNIKKTFVYAIQEEDSSGIDYYEYWPSQNSYVGDDTIPLKDKVFVDTATKKTYRWSGSDLAEISATVVLGETATTAFPGDRGLALETGLRNVKYSLETKVEKSDVETIETAINKSVTTETSEREAADTAEAAERKSADEKLQGQIDALDKFAVMTEDEYDALETKDENTYYMLTED